VQYPWVVRARVDIRQFPWQRLLDTKVQYELYCKISVHYPWVVRARVDIRQFPWQRLLDTKVQYISVQYPWVVRARVDIRQFPWQRLLDTKVQYRSISAQYPGLSVPERLLDTKEQYSSSSIQCRLIGWVVVWVANPGHFDWIQIHIWKYPFPDPTSISHYPK
jgi:hypothetical protein